MTVHPKDFVWISYLMFTAGLAFLLFDFNKQIIKDLGYGPLFLLIQRILGALMIYTSLKIHALRPNRTR